MTWTYDSSDPGASDKDQIRLMVGDTDTSDQLMQDEEITYFVTTYTTVGSAAVAVARAILSVFARQVTKAVGDLRINASDRYKAYAEHIANLEELALASDPYQIYVGGQSFDEINSDLRDIDLPQGRFAVGMHDYPRRGVDHGHPRKLSDLDQ